MYLIIPKNCLYLCMKESVKKVMKLLVMTSEYRRHPSNMAKEYLYMHETEEILTLGEDCIYITDVHRYSKIIKKDDGSYMMEYLSGESFTKCFGISLSNVLTLLINKGVVIMGIHTVKEEYGKRAYHITIKGNDYYNQAKVLTFVEPNNLDEFYYTDIFVHLSDLYGL